MIAGCLLSVLVGGCSHPDADEIERVLASYADLGERVDWPGFDPAAVPLALFDDQRTFLAGHPSPPPRFRPMRGVGGVAVADTTFAELRANSDVEFAGARVAGVLIPPRPMRSDSIAALLIHEAFHAYQTSSAPGWTANEVDLFTYPTRSAPLLHRRRLETGALGRAVAARDSLQWLCWSHAFLQARRDRYAMLAEAFIRYERATELREGLARYVEGAARGAPDPALPTEGFRPEDVRERAYETGRALAILLDRTARGWKDTLTAGDPIALDALLERFLPSAGFRPCSATPDEAARAGAVAAADIASLAERDRLARDRFESAPGWRIEIVADPEPLSPERFDPLNVRVLDEAHVLHTRWLRVSSASVSAEVLGRSALTRGRPGHPLFAGLDRVWVTGLREPSVVTEGDTTRITAEGLSVTVVRAAVERIGQLIRIVTADTENAKP